MKAPNIKRRLHETLAANAAAYRRLVRGSAPGQCWDVLVLTAANEKQAQGYRQELAMRQRSVGPTHAFFPQLQRSIVIADPPGQRIGSGGATLNVLRALSEQLKLSIDELVRLRILLIHSGGLSQRLPPYSPLGKIFAPLPLLRPDGQIATLFDHLYLTVAALPEKLGAGMLALAGDVFLIFDHREVAHPAAGVTALSMRVPAELGLGHGVYLTDVDGRIVRNLQKVSIDTMRGQGAMNNRGEILIDTGLFFFDAMSTRAMAQLAGVPGRSPLHERHQLPLSLYEEMSDAMTAEMTLENFTRNPRTRAMHEEIFGALHGVGFHAMDLNGEFLHLGTTRQFRDAMVGSDPSPAAGLFQQNVLARGAWPSQADRRVYHSVLAKGAGTVRLGRRCVVEHSVLHPGSRIGAGSVVSQVNAAERPLVLREDRLLFQAPVLSDGKALIVHVECGVMDDFKSRRFLNEPLEDWMNRSGATSEDLWAGIEPEKRTLWNARLFIATETRALPADAGIEQWRSAPRFSMDMILQSVDPAALIGHRETVLAYLQAMELLELIAADRDAPVDSVMAHYASPQACAAADTLLTNADFGEGGRAPLRQARAMWCAAQLLMRTEQHDRGNNLMSRAFEKVAAASEAANRPMKVRLRSRSKLPAGIEVIAHSPVRLDLSGGWTDTPPYCFERGGHVVNVAIDLDGKPPVIATVRTIRQRKLILESRDLGEQIELDQPPPREQIDVRDPFALHKVALDISGLRELRLHVTTECRVPKGSGLGTSSILAATLLAALQSLRGRTPSMLQLAQQTILLEQRLSTGGGWQDQVGGIVGGVKSTITRPGLPQRLRIEPLRLSASQYQTLQERLVVYYSGQQRLARDILRQVMGRWLAREPGMLELMKQLKQSAAALRAALMSSRWKQVAREIDRYWQIKKALYPGSTTATTDVLLIELRDHYLAAGLAGAGGGGFAYFFCAGAKQAARLRERLAERITRPGILGTVYDTQIDRKGLTVQRRRAQGAGGD